MISFLCPSCHQPLSVEDQHAGQLCECPYCHWSIQAPGAQPAPLDSEEDDDVPSEALVPPAYKSPGLAAMLSIVPGFGQFYNGQFKKGLAFMFFLLAIGLMAYYGKHSKFEKGFLSPLGLLIIGIVSALLIWLLCIYDAHRTAVRKNEMGY